mmetsp:Transcript_17300/g.37331  ORF Transcript_17300/g.37331 Transcript_17300/m.37331 type:complete len:459 (-) Transcript_17300:854-2230(-)|eukprot:CAMPEP_0202898454 /NCGR_PEP_ID=MMETSP1392-20130828/6972_1 /ASSEMBLY_ACC=CAM_ASM_000868 /TAXON_ID=225041 /ORGANISM="Chlamydomonas chlamydogama, Strain SAG 11-48b" /LENGTH=458 /DNA_ID=CAMNT_0049584387 /DNA_START=123 /DNA_END=1499 /DNA_ORIENTATION=-
MPIELANDVYGSTLKDKTHKGPNQAGNKSLLAFRADIGVPGYTGYIPGPASIVLPVKNFQRTGKPVDSAFKDTTTLATVENAKTKRSEYNETLEKVPTDTKAFSRSGGGYWISERKIADNKPFLATSTYRAETLAAPESAEQQLTRSLGLSCTIANYEAARQTAPRAQSAAPTTRATQREALLATQRPATAVTSYGELVGYQTTNKSMLVRDPLTGGKAAAGNLTTPLTAPRTTPLEQRFQTMPRAMAPGMYGEHSMYRANFGEDCSDPMERTAPGERFQTRLSTTRELAEGTTRNTNHLPGYTGHQPASKYHELARAQADAADERLSAKTDMLLYHLDQFNRGRIPRYTGYKPKDAKNITMEQPSQGPPTNTTYGTGNLQATKSGVPPVDNTYYNNSRAGIMTFFTSAGEYVSDNGLSNAQEYYKLANRGAEARFKSPLASKTTYYGAKFNPRTSLV